jgi:hypothetical protein
VYSVWSTVSRIAWIINNRFPLSSTHPNFVTIQRWRGQNRQLKNLARLPISHLRFKWLSTMPKAPTSYSRQRTCNLGAYGVHVRGYIHVKILGSYPTLGKQLLYEFPQNFRLHGMHEPVIFCVCRGEWHPSHLPEFCNLSKAHLVKLHLRRRMYDTERNRPISRSRLICPWCWCGELGPFAGYTGTCPALEM